MCLQRVIARFEPPKVEEVMGFKVVLQKDNVTRAPFARVPLRTDVWIAENREIELGKVPDNYRCGFHVCETEKHAELVANFIEGHKTFVANEWRVAVVPVMVREIVAEGYDCGAKVLVARQIFCFREMPSVDNFGIDDWNELVAA